MNITDPVTMLLSIILCVFLAILLYGWKRRSPNFPPGPTPLPLIGNMHILDSKQPYRSMHELSKKYGPVYSIQIAEETMVVLCGYETIKDALVNHADEFSGRPIIPLFHEITKGHGMTFSNDENWKVMRRFTMTALRDFGMGKKTIEDRILEECDCLVKEIKSFKGEPFDNSMILNAAVANIIVSILLSHRFDYDDSTYLRLLQIFDENIKILGSPSVMLYNAFPSIIRWFPGTHRTVVQNQKEMHEFIRETFTTQRNELDVNDQRNLIDAFLVKQQEEKPGHQLFFTNENLTMLVTDLFSAGMETTSTSLRWGILLMIIYPDIQRKVQNEIEKVTGSSPPQAGHRKDMPYTDAVIHEIQRFGNIVPANVPHATTQDVNFRGYFLPKGTHIIPLLTSVLHDEAYFERPEEFNPEHFLDAKGNFVKKEAFIPFSAGKRICVGETLAKMELFLFFVRLLQTFTFKAPPGTKLDLKAAVGFTRGPLRHNICAVSRIIHVAAERGMPSCLVADMYLTDPVTIILSIAICVFLAIVLYGQKKKVHPNYPPGPPCLPIIGNMHMINIEKPYITFLELAKKYGTVYSLQIGSQKIVVLCGYETVKDALVNHAEEFAGRPSLPLLTDISKGHGFIFANGNSWKAMRRFTLSTLRDFGMGKRTIEDKIMEECKSLCHVISAFKGKPFENTMIMNAAVSNIIVSILLGYRFNYDDPQLLRLLTIVNDNIRIIGSPMAQFYNSFPSLVRWLPGSHREVYTNSMEMQMFVKETFTNQKKQLDVNDQRNLIDAFLVKQKEEKPNPELYFNDKNLTFLVMDLFAAGMETTSTTLRWGLLLMMKYPEIQKKVQDEIEKVIGSGEPSLIHRKQMPYTDAVIHEIQRFANIVPTNIPHATTEDTNFKGFFIPKGTQVIPLLYSVLRDKEYFEKPEEFHPQHFLDSEGNLTKNEAFIPFSAGKRSCAGENMAKMELFLFFTSLLQNFTFQSPPGAKLDLTGAVGFTTPPLKHEICAIPRN
ncbi:uncharacterized protein ACMZJ9_007480 [Mantella aurantiaca]